MRVYKCDNDRCNKETESLSELMSIGTSDETNNLYIINNIRGHRMKNMGKHRDIHFCSKECFIDLFWGKLESELLAVTPNNTNG